jgi:tetratricopeptide (TPR) repeat protein
LAIIAVVLLASLVNVAVFFWSRTPVAPPPAVDTTGFDPVIAKAIAEAHAAAKAEPSSSKARGHLGMVLLAHDVRGPARGCFQVAAQLQPKEPRWWYFLGMAELADHPVSGASNLLRAVALFPSDAIVPRLRLADALIPAGDLDGAEREFRRAQQVQPSSGSAALGLAKIANSRGQASEALQFLTVAQKDPATRKAAHRLLVSVNQRLGRPEAAEQLNRAMADLPNDLPLDDPYLAEVEALEVGEKAWVDLADKLIQAGETQQAIQLLQKTLAHYPNSSRAMFFLGRAQLRLGDLAGAEAMLSRSVALAPASVEAQMQLGVVRLRQGRAWEATSCFRAAIAAKPNLAEGWFNLGLSLGTGPAERAEAIQAFREAIRIKPNLFDAYLALAVALRVDGKLSEAASHLTRALELGPEPALRKRLQEQLELTAAR